MTLSRDERLLAFVRLRGEVYSVEVARELRVSIVGARKMLRLLEELGLLVSHRRLDPRRQGPGRRYYSVA